MKRTTTRRAALVAACLIVAVGVTACGDDDDSAAEVTETITTAAIVEAEEPTATTVESEAPSTTAETEAPSATTVESETAAGETIVVTAVDYNFEGLPETVPVGTKISLVNEGNEPHEFVAIRIPDEETRTVEELLMLPEEELGAVFGAAEPATVILAATGQTDVPGAVVGDGTLDEPGRYAIVCFFPLGSDDSILESAGPPEGGDTPPHASQGMAAELTVVP